MNRDLEDSTIHLEMERTSFYLRLQNVLESKDEDLGAIMSHLIAKALQRDQQEIVKELDEVFRIHTNYARRNKLPREVHIRFTRKNVIDIVYRIRKDEPMVYKEKEITILK
uniref:L1 transposable element RRM domain-containing protein n=1 Tax=Micrurus surinamensis TaxID=129470 RepID=A0A2D4NYG9_MICSU